MCYSSSVIYSTAYQPFYLLVKKTWYHKETMLSHWLPMDLVLMHTYTLESPEQSGTIFFGYVGKFPHIRTAAISHYKTPHEHKCYKITVTATQIF